MKALILSAGDDTGGVGFGLAQALNRHTNWEARAVNRTLNYINYPTDILWPPNEPKPAWLDRLFAEADVVHVMERWQAVQPFDGWEAKPLVMHHHGTIFRNNYRDAILLTAQFGAVAIVSTPDLTLLDPSAEWLPNPCDIGRMRSFVFPHESLVVGHSPTSHAWKGTESFIQATTGMNVDVIEKVSWDECLERKGRCDIFFDQFYIGYALAGIEAMAMGIPVVSGAVDPRITALGIPGGKRLVDLLANLFGYLPFLLADQTNLRERILELVEDSALRDNMSALGEYHVNRWHDEAKVAQRLVGIYERAMALR